MPKSIPGAPKWSPEDSADVYHVNKWGAGFFRVNDAGHMEVTPHGAEGPHVDLALLVQELRARGLGLPVLVRFPGIIQRRIQSLMEAFENAIETESYQGRYHCIYPIKVNQQRPVVEAVLTASEGRPVGLEAGSKPELLAALAILEEPDALLILNGYKDAEFVETALLARKIGRDAIIVVDRFRELKTILSVADRLGVKPRIGVRAQLDARAEGKWEHSSGPGSKFGLDPGELLAVVDRLAERGMLDSLVLLHFHLGSQITGIQGLKEAVQEGARVYCELVQLGAPLQYLDVGGGLGVDYDGSQTTNQSSMNYDLREYANNVIFHVREMCDERDVPHPDIITESGRAMVAHHSVLVFDLPDMDPGLPELDLDAPSEDEHRILVALHETLLSVSEKRYLECWHDANHFRVEAVALFAHGVLSLRERAQADALYRACCARILRVIRGIDPQDVPEELADLERRFCDIYFGNFSIFQSAPDHWAVSQLFPVMPIQRLDEEPTCRGIVADLTCDSDGIIDRFIGDVQEQNILPLHPPSDGEYLLGVFLLGAYQETLGDLHNLFGDTNAVQVSVDEDGAPVLEDVIEHDSVADVLGYVGYRRRSLLRKVRRAVEAALRRGDISLPESALFLKDYERGLLGTTYLEEDGPELGTFGLELGTPPAAREPLI
ncbi:MAG: biosynthetic arginine decarboxylase [Gemmatimonadota bacterium]|nr:MAG: biosynthetic arginine decarboxylase [Gemmatimonadota bacterium]